MDAGVDTGAGAEVGIGGGVGVTGVGVGVGVLSAACCACARPTWEADGRRCAILRLRPAMDGPGECLLACVPQPINTMNSTRPTSSIRSSTFLCTLLTSPPADNISRQSPSLPSRECNTLYLHLCVFLNEPGTFWMFHGTP